MIESNRLIELVVEKHRRLLETYNNEFSELDSRLNNIKQQFDAIKKEMGTTESRIDVLNEKYHLLFHQAKKQREETFSLVIEKMRGKNIQDIMRTGSIIGELEKKLQTARNIEDEEKIIAEMEKLLRGFESQAKDAGIIVTCKGIMDKLNEANFSHRELLSIQDIPKQHAESTKDYETQISENEKRINWLKHRIGSHNGALAYWEKQKEGIKVG